MFRVLFCTLTALTLTIVPNLLHGQSDDNYVHKYVDKDPEFGERGDLDVYIKKHLKYPEKALKNKVSGQIRMRFIVEKNGDLTNIYAEAGLGDGCVEAATEILENMPKWTPAQKDSVPVRTMQYCMVYFELPKSFKQEFRTYAVQGFAKNCVAASDTYAEFPNKDDAYSALKNYINTHIQYPESALAYNIEGDVKVAFIVEKNGAITHPKVIKGLGAGCDEEALRLVQAMPKWKPAKLKRKKVAQIVMKDIYFRLPNEQKRAIIAARSPAPPPSSNSDYEIMDFVENRASFPGGEAALEAYLRTNLQYPAAARAAYTQGRVVVKGIVEKDGSLTNLQIKKSIGNGCDEEALRLVKTMPAWIPANTNGRNLRYKLLLPILFKLD